MSAVVTAPAFSPAPIVMLIASAPLLIVKWSTMIEVPAAGAAFSSSHALASALVALIIHPNFPGLGVVIEIAINYLPFKNRKDCSFRCWGYLVSNAMK